MMKPRREIREISGKKNEHKQALDREDKRQKGENRYALNSTQFTFYIVLNDTKENVFLKTKNQIPYK